MEQFDPYQHSCVTPTSSLKQIKVQSYDDTTFHYKCSRNNSSYRVPNEDKIKITLKKYRASDKLKLIHYISTVKLYNLLENTSSFTGTNYLKVMKFSGFTMPSLQISTGHRTFVWQIWSFDWWMLSLTWHVDWALQLWCEI